MGRAAFNMIQIWDTQNTMANAINRSSPSTSPDVVSGSGSTSTLTAAMVAEALLGVVVGESESDLQIMHGAKMRSFGPSYSTDFVCAVLTRASGAMSDAPPVSRMLMPL